MKYPNPPNWRDIDMVWSYFCHLFSTSFRASISFEIEKCLQKNRYTEDDMGWPQIQKERRKVVENYLIHVAAAVTDGRPSPDQMIAVHSLLRDAYITAVSSIQQERVQDIALADQLTVTDDFDFPKFKHAFLSEVTYVGENQYTQYQWKSFYDSWGGFGPARIALTKTHKKRLNLPDDLFLNPNDIEIILQKYVQSAEKNIRVHGGETARLFPWPVR